MGQAPSSLEGAQRLVERDFAGRLVFSHGLFHSLQCGSYALCQVDLTGETPAKPRNDIGTEVVVQIIVLNEEQKSGSANFGKDRGKLTEVTEHDDTHGTANGGVTAPITESENTTSKVQYQKAPSFEEWGKNNRREKELWNGAVSDHGNDKIEVQCEKSPSFEECQSTTQREHQVTELMSKLAPSVTIAPVSFNQLLSDIHKFKAENFSNAFKHPNLVPVIGAYKGDNVLYIVFPKAPFSVESILHFSPSAFGSDDHIRLLLFEILAGLAHCHKLGVYHGNLRPWNILVINPAWCWLTGFGKQQEDYVLAEARVSDWTGVFKRWWAGEVSNYDYLLLLNKLAGRRWGDECFHTVMPWVIDFSVKPDTSSSRGWRDLTKSKWRLAKGDEQLDFTYANAEIPHHVSDECLSELAVCNYKARRLPLLLLRRIVRSVYEPNEYPSSMKRLYQWTPDECIPEFYSDPDVFTSVHSGMSDLAVPPWARSAEEFIRVHRGALESDRVSQLLHHWIDLTFGYKLSGQAAVDAKNVTLSSSPSVARCSGRRQLFSIPHPRRRQQQVVDVGQRSGAFSAKSEYGVLATKRELDLEPDAVDFYSSSVVDGDLERASRHLKQVAPLEDLKEASFFAEKARHLSCCYAPRARSKSVTKKLSLGISNKECEAHLPLKESSFFAEKISSGGVAHNLSLGIPNKEECEGYLEASPLHRAHLLVSKDAFRLAEELREVAGDGGLEDLVWWEALRQQQQQGVLCSEAEGGDVFAVACVVAEVYLRRPLFDPVSMAAFEESGALPEIMNQLPPSVAALIKPALHPDFHHRPSVEMLIKSPFFSSRIRAVYSFLAPLHSLQSGRERLQFAADMAMLSAFQKLGAVATEMVAPSCLALVIPFASSVDPAAVVCLLNELLRALKPHLAQQLVLPVIEHLLQSREFPALQLALVQPPFLEDARKILGTAAYLSHLHPLILSNLRRSPAGRLEEACGTVLLSMCQHLGIPITLNQTLTPIMLSFGRDISVAGMDALVAIGERLGERVVVKHILPAARFIVSVGLQLLSQTKVTPSQSLRLLAMVDAMAVLDRIIARIPTSTILSELLQDPNNVYVKILLQPKMTQNLLQCAAKALLLACQRVGPEVTAALVLLQLKPFFDEMAFAYEQSLENSKRAGNSSTSVPAADASVEDDSTSSERMGIVYILYPGFASLLGIEKLRQSLSTWLLLEQALLKHFNWKWGGSTSAHPKTPDPQPPKPDFPYDCNPANLLLDGVRWSIPLSKTPSTTRTPDSPPDLQDSSPPPTDEPWTWVPPFLAENLESSSSPSSSSSSSSSREQAWKLSAVILHSVRVHSGAMRAFAVGEDEGTVFTAGGSGVVRQWKLASSQCCMEYAGHQEAVIDICALPGNRAASCDGTLHIWSPRTGAQLAVFDESAAATASTLITNLMSSSFETGRLPVRKSADGGASSIGGHVYTCLHSMEVEEKIVTGTVNGSLRFFDTVEGRRLFLWRCDLGESYMSSYVSALASCGQRTCSGLGTKCVAAGYSSGHCRVLDYRSGRVVMNWRAHDASVTKLDVLDGNYLVSSSTDKTLRLWDLRRNAPTQLQTFKGHLDGVVSFALRATDMLSAAGNKIGLSSLSKSPQSGQETQVIQPQRLYTAHQRSRSFSRIISISVLPFSRLFLVGTEDGFLKVCS